MKKLRIDSLWRSHVLALALVAAALVAVASPSVAGVTTYTDEATFQAAAGSLVLHDFDSLVLDDPGTVLGQPHLTLTTQLCGMTFTNAEVIPSCCGGGNRSAPNIVFNWPDLTNPGWEIVIVFTEPVLSVGLWNSSIVDGETFEILDSNDDSIASLVAPVGSVNFGGFTADGGTSIKKLVISPGPSTNGSIFIDDLQVGPTVSGVPPSCPGEDGDGDGVNNDDDNCPDTASGEAVDTGGCSDAQVDGDGDGVCDPGAASAGPSMCTGSDNCPDDANVGQDDLDDDGVGDVCDDDADGDGDPATSDCDDLDPTRYAGATEICTDGVDNNCNGQIDEQADGADCDADGVPNELDNCPLDYNEFQEDLDGDGLGDVCDGDIDGDTVANDDDNCPVNANPDQADLDGDGAGDACDADADGDGLDDATADLCLGTTTDPIAGVPSKSLGKNRWAEMDGNAQFDTNGNNPTGRMFSVYTTGGCSCAQIIEICGYGQGHTKFGCSNSVMDWWTGLYDREGEAPYQCKED